MEYTIAAISTATGQAGIGIVRMSGETAFEIAKKVFRRINDQEITAADNRKLLYGYIRDGEEMIDEVLVAFMKAPHTYTREDVVEIYTHGGIIAVRKVLNLLLQNGCELAERGEFTKRAFLNGRLDLSQAEAVIDLIDAKTDASYENGIKQLAGSLKNQIKKLRDELLDVLAHFEYAINFTEDFQEEPDLSYQIEKAESILDELIKLYNSANKGKIIRDGIQTTIIGKPNVGKSSLLNALVKENKAIVTDIPGTTRDVIEEFIELDGIALKIMDTAGIRSTEDVVEKLGVDKSMQFAESADLLIALFDASREFDGEDQKILKLLKEKKSIVVINKDDLEMKWDEKKLDGLENTPIIRTSIKNNIGIEKLEQTIIDLFNEGELLQSNDTLITNVRHQEVIRRAIYFLKSSLQDMKMNIPIDCVEVDLRNSWEILGEITGETIEEDVLNKIFSSFCIGK